VNPADAKAIVGEARKRITVAADYARDEQIGVAFMRLNDLYSKSVVAQDYRTALAAQKELTSHVEGKTVPGGGFSIPLVKRWGHFFSSAGLTPEIFGAGAAP